MQVCLDSRLIQKGDYFVPIKGENFDGHIFVDDVLKKGAAGIIEEEELYKLAKEKLSNANIITIAIAGAVGKSTFRTYLTQLLCTKYRVLEGNLNTKLGLATTIINELSDQKVFIAELGIDRIGEMQETSNFINPDFVVYTKFEKEHLLYLKDLKTAIKENITCIKNTKEKLAYINLADRDLVSNLVKKFKIEYFKFNSGDTKFVQNFDFPNHEKDYISCINMILKERFNFLDTDFLAGLKNLKRPNGRLNLLNGLNESLILDDSYNSVCDSGLIEGLKYAKQISKKYNKELNIIISPMRETGLTEGIQHKNVAEAVNKLNFKSLTIVGDSTGIFKKYLKVDYSILTSSEDFNFIPTKQDLFYFKGSQFYRLEKAVEKVLDKNLKAKDVLVRQDVRWA